MTKNYFMTNDIPLESVETGISRKVLAYSDNLMMVEVHFDTGAIGAMHHHVHEQATYVLSGAFEFTIDGVRKTVRAGDSMYKQPDIEHGAVCLEAGILLDVFTPMRKDFI